MSVGHVGREPEHRSLARERAGGLAREGRGREVGARGEEGVADVLGVQRGPRLGEVFDEKIYHRDVPRRGISSSEVRAELLYSAGRTFSWVEVVDLRIRRHVIDREPVSVGLATHERTGDTSNLSLL